MKLGFSTGASKNFISKEKAVEYFAQQKYTAVELGLGQTCELLDRVNIKTLQKFKWVSIHAPKIELKLNDPASELTIKKINNFYKKFPVNLVIIHPSLSMDYRIFKKAEFPIGFENMDKRKPAFTTPTEMNNLFKKIPTAKMVLDVNHVFTHDKSMELAQEFYLKCGDRIAEIHISGYKKLHEPIYLTKQPQILQAIQNTSVPLIIESTLGTIEEIEKEYHYIENYLKK